MSIILRVGAVKCCRLQETQLASGNESSSSYTDTDMLDIPLPEHTHPRPHHPGITYPFSTTDYCGLPYQDHNYSMPPPPSLSHPVLPGPPSPLQVSGFVQMEEEVRTTPLVSIVEEIVEDSITRCICGYLHDDGYMICCDKCSVWQHIDCMGIDCNSIPENYFCELCQPRIVDNLKAKQLQKRKREQLAVRSVLSDTDQEAASSYTTVGRKMKVQKRKGLQLKFDQKMRNNQGLPNMKLERILSDKRTKKLIKNNKENMKCARPKKIFKLDSEKLKHSKGLGRPLLALNEQSADFWNNNYSPLVDSHEFAYENQYSPAVQVLSANSRLVGQPMDVSPVMADDLSSHLTCVADVQKNRKGLTATQDIPEGQAIIEYKGRVLLRHEYDRELEFFDSCEKLEPFVLFYSKMNVDICVNAQGYGNEARFVRRSCNPNSEVQHFLLQGKVCFFIISVKDISTGSEITIPFDYNYKECSFCVECACNRNNCAVTRYWRRLLNAQRYSHKGFTIKQKRQLSNGLSDAITLDNIFSPNIPAASHTSASTSLDMDFNMKLETDISLSLNESHEELSSMSNLIAASVLLDGQPDVVSSFKEEVSNSNPSSPFPGMSSSFSKRENKPADPVTEDIFATSVDHTKVKCKNTENKENRDESNFVELKKVRRRHWRQCHKNAEDVTTDLSGPRSRPHKVTHEDASLPSECSRKMTREERKLDAILKAFEKMEKREERRKEALARGDCCRRKCSGYSKLKKKLGSNVAGKHSASGCCSHPMPQDESGNGEDMVKMDSVLISTNGANAKAENGGRIGYSIFPSLSSDITSRMSTVLQGPHGAITEKSSKQPLRKGKRAKRKSKIHNNATTSDTASVSTDDGSSNSSFPCVALSVPVTPAITSSCASLPPTANVNGGFFKYIKTKKHLFEEWSMKHDDESCKHEEVTFIQCLPNPHVNTVDHLQRRNVQTGGCNNKCIESGAGSAKKRWLRKAMHEVPVNMTSNQSLSVNTDSNGESPLHSSTVHDPGACLGSPGPAAGSPKPLDFLTPLKKRRLFRESLSSEVCGSTCTTIPVENLTSDSVDVTPKMNGLQPAHIYSSDDVVVSVFSPNKIVEQSESKCDPC